MPSEKAYNRPLNNAIPAVLDLQIWRPDLQVFVVTFAYVLRIFIHQPNYRLYIGLLTEPLHINNGKYQKRNKHYIRRG